MTTLADLPAELRGKPQMTPEQAERLRHFFKHYLNRFMIGCYQLGLGKLINIWPPVFGQFMVITHTGRKSGLKRRTPVNFAIHEGDIYCTAGFGAAADWYRNMLVNPAVEVWLPGEWWTATAEDVSNAPDAPARMRDVLKGAGFAAFAAGINPYAMSDAELAEISAPYRLVRIRRAEARTGAGGPDEYAWVWPALIHVLVLLLPVLLLRRRRR